MGGKSIRAAGLLLAAIAGVASVALTATPAAAHNSLTSSDPKDGASLAKAPAQVTLTFLARLDPRATKITLTGPDNVSAASAAPTFSGSKATVGFRPGPAGLYTVGYELPSSDGHPIKGKIKFTLTVGTTPTEPPTPSATPAAAPTPTPSATTPAPALTPLAGSGQDKDGDSTWWPWAIGAAVVLLAALIGTLLTRRHRSRTT
ncbi:copper resistance CopC family protein [Micromonospora sp. NBC_01796]|uniref:copper resistance CopC family protein n=1 Tax=Micromonospora sp. NBC_01796 TaxID=2975987 RepID=UPI002DD7E33D|nr:copper resistance CopC family protein [Micromonospora sp. NBC_01796]WSA83173.1 copper resistance protein CopC [Micromonospora sp. NBC_01796]